MKNILIIEDEKKVIQVLKAYLEKSGYNGLTGIEMFKETKFDLIILNLTIDVHIENLRKKIEEDNENPRYIITVVKTCCKFGCDSDV